MAHKAGCRDRTPSTVAQPNMNPGALNPVLSLIPFTHSAEVNPDEHRDRATANRACLPLFHDRVGTIGACK